MSDDVWYRVQGDKKDTIVGRLGGVQDLLTVSTVQTQVRLGRTRVALAAAITDPVGRLVTTQLGAAPSGWLLTAALGEWLVEHEILFLDGTELTWPNRGKGRLIIGPQLDP